MAEAPKTDNAKTSDVYKTLTKLPERFNDPSVLKGYEEKPLHPVYRTSSSTYGGTAPSIHTMPNQFHGRGNKFTSHMAAAGNYEYHGLNTALDKSPV
ncbi:piercer of microtubule wall 1 protein-like [Bolinopsis microptera]|uniref:piercer of microtubule wall 1 protein-like n=1 Tax=Bolinopsis microptera TaxID=2820187 RepID=UPI00307A995D